MEESERHSEEELEALWEKFCINETEIGAKYLWLQYTLLKRDEPESKLDVPDNVIEKMIKIIKYDIQFYEDQGYTSYGALSKKETENSVFMLLDLAKNNPKNFWKILQTPCNNVIFDADLLEKTRIAFPQKRKLGASKLYTFFGAQLGMKQEESGHN